MILRRRVLLIKFLHYELGFFPSDPFSHPFCHLVFSFFCGGGLPAFLILYKMMCTREVVSQVFRGNYRPQLLELLHHVNCKLNPDFNSLPCFGFCCHPYPTPYAVSFPLFACLNNSHREDIFMILF